MSDTDTLVETVSADDDMSQLWRKLEAAVNEIDREIDSWNPETGVKRTFLNELVSEEEETWRPQVEKLTEQLNAFDERKRYALFLGLINGLNGNFRKSSDEWVDAQVEALPKPEKVEVSPEHRAEVSKKRSEYYTMMKQLHQVATGFNMSFAKDWVLPKVRRGGAGKRGKRALSLYDYAINGEELSGDANSPVGVAEALGFEKSSQFTKALKDIGVVRDLDSNEDVKINTSKPPRSFEVTINGKLVTATRISEEDLDEDEDDSDDGEED